MESRTVLYVESKEIAYLLLPCCGTRKPGDMPSLRDGSIYFPPPAENSIYRLTAMRALYTRRIAASILYAHRSAASIKGRPPAERDSPLCYCLFRSYLTNSFEIRNAGMSHTA